MIYHDIWCSFWTHDTNMISQKIKIMIHRQKISCPVSCVGSTASVSCFGINDIWTWYRSGMTWDMRWQTIFTLTMISLYRSISISIISYHVLSFNVSQREWFTHPVETSLTTWGEGWSTHLPHRLSCQPPWEPPILNDMWWYVQETNARQGKAHALLSFITSATSSTAPSS